MLQCRASIRLGILFLALALVSTGLVLPPDRGWAAPDRSPALEQHPEPVLAGGTRDGEPVLTSSLARAINDPRFPGRDARGRVAVWVFFVDKGLTGAALDAALSAEEARLPERSVFRRAKVLPAGRRLVDVTDLALFQPYLDQVAATGAVPRQQSRWLDAASFDVTRAQLQVIAELACVRRLDLVRRSSLRPLPLSPADEAGTRHREELLERLGERYSLDYGGSLVELEQINVPAVHEAGYHGQGVLIGMLDTGFKTTHECLVNADVIDRYDFVNDDPVVENEPGDPSSAHNHGTQTLSTILGFEDGSLIGPAFGASVVLAKTEDVADEQPIEEDYWVAGIEWLDTFGVDVVSSSLGYKNWYDWEDLDGETAVTTIAADLAVGKGIVVCNSAGNERGSSWNHIIAPADGDSVITVGAVTSSGSYAYFSSPGPTYDGRIKPDVCALGLGNHVAAVSDDTGYSSAAGTSFSCPLTAGVAALILSRVPALTPLQVREAMRETADRAGSPDNDYGWGILDACAAVFYFGASFEHVPLADTEDTSGPYLVGCRITDRVPLDPLQLHLFYRRTDQGWTQTPLLTAGTDSFYAYIPGQIAGSEVEYYLQAGDSLGVVTALPPAAPDSPFTFHIGPDLVSPVLVHTPLSDQPLLTWPAEVRATVTDNLGVAQVWVEWDINDVVQAPFDLLIQGGDQFAAAFPIAAGELQAGDHLTYNVSARDVSAAGNEASTGDIHFEIVDALGIVVVVDDSGGAAAAGRAGTADPGSAATAADVKYDAQKRLLTAAAPVAPPVAGTDAGAGKSTAAEIQQWLEDAGYLVDLLSGDEVSPGDLTGYQAVVLSCGENLMPVADAGLRSIIEDWVSGGGKLLVEGGEVGYDAVSYPGYPGFAGTVLHCLSWQADSAGDLQVVGGMEAHPLLNLPHVVPGTVAINYSGYGDEDALDPAADAYVVMGTASYPAAAGILVHDDNPAPQAAQIVFYAFNLDAVADEPTARQLIENGMAFLLADEGVAAASIAGTVILVGQTDHSGVVICCVGGDSTMTDSAGAYLLEDLHAGSYMLMASKAGFEIGLQEVELAEGQILTGVDFTLRPVSEYVFSDTPELSIPDGDPAGVSTAIPVVLTGLAGKSWAAVSGLTVDIDLSHTWIGDLIIDLTSPTGTTVRLHDRSGGNNDDISGNYPTTLMVDGPGSLDDFLGEDPAGDWILFVADSISPDDGILHTWGLHLWLPDVLADVPATTLPARTALLPNAPNPFNPRTVIQFDLARAGRLRLSIYDLRGRQVRRLVDGSLPAGRHQVTWDGRNGAGHRVSSGSYLYRLVGDGVVQERKMLLVK